MFFYINGEAINNNTIRELFNISDKYKYKASRIIKDTIDAELIKLVDKNTAPRYNEIYTFLGII